MTNATHIVYVIGILIAPMVLHVTSSIVASILTSFFEDTYVNKRNVEAEHALLAYLNCQ